MGELSLRRIGGGKRIYTIDDCTYDTTSGVLTLPAGVTWGDIDKFLFAGASANNYSMFEGGVVTQKLSDTQTIAFDGSAEYDKRTTVSLFATTIDCSGKGYRARYRVECWIVLK